MSSKVDFCDLCPDILYGIAKFLNFQDQVKQERVNKTWCDAIGQAFRDYKTLIVEQKITQNCYHIDEFLDCGLKTMLFNHF